MATCFCASVSMQAPFSATTRISLQKPASIFNLGKTNLSFNLHHRVPARLTISCAVEIVMGLEEEFGITMAEERAQKITTVEQAAELIEELVKEKAA